MNAPRIVMIATGLVAAVACSATDDRAPTPGSSTTPNDPGTPPSSSSGGDTGVSGQTDPGAASSSGQSGGTPADDEPTTPYVHYDINHIVSTGQSNSVAHGGVPPLTSTQPFKNLMFDVGVMTSGACEGQGCRVYQKPSSFVPLVEGDTFYYPVETMSSGMGNEAALLAHTKYADAAHDVLVSLAGRNGLTYWCLRKGTCNFVDPTYVVSFDESLMQVKDAKALAAAAGRSYAVRVITSVHGESDDFGYAMGTPEFPLDGTDGSFKSIKDYADGLIEWQRDLSAGIQAITGQTTPIPLLVSQHSGWNDVPTSAVAIYQYQAHVRSKGNVVLVTPGYPFDYASDCRHYTSDGERRMGGYFAKAYARIVLEGKRWEPVHPRTVTLAGTVITAKFHVPVPPLVLDTQRVLDPGNYGFEVVDGAGANVAITKVELTGPDTVVIRLAAAPAGDARLRYAYTGVPHTCPGRFVGPRGNLRDSDATPSQYGYEMFNWGVHFEEPVTR